MFMLSVVLHYSFSGIPHALELMGCSLVSLIVSLPLHKADSVIGQQMTDRLLLVSNRSACYNYRENKKALDPEFDPTPTTGYATWQTLMRHALSIRETGDDW